VTHVSERNWKHPKQGNVKNLFDSQCASKRATSPSHPQPSNHRGHGNISHLSKNPENINSSNTGTINTIINSSDIGASNATIYSSNANINS